MGMHVICLALSKREGGYCLAGVERGKNRWVRPIAGQQRPELHFSKLPKLLDVWDIPLTGPAPEIHQPENWLVGQGDWRLVERITDDAAASLLSELTTAGPELLRNHTDRIRCMDIKAHPLAASVRIIRPRDIRFYVAWGTRQGQRQARCAFSLDGANYDLSVTDSAFEARLLHDFKVGSGRHTPKEAGVPVGAALHLCVSLTGAFNGNHFKLVAGVLPVHVTGPSV
jgi:hypothetical protein